MENVTFACRKLPPLCVFWRMDALKFLRRVLLNWCIDNTRVHSAVCNHSDTQLWRLIAPCSNAYPFAAITFYIGEERIF
eukprot:IDg3956t1